VFVFAELFCSGADEISERADQLFFSADEIGSDSAGFICSKQA
jgi:hypothetical protein